MEHINWYPGHMKKTRELIQENLKLVDIVIEVLDSRIPISSRNPIIEELTKGKDRIIILNKSDLSDEEINKKWISHFQGMKNSDNRLEAITFNGVTGIGIKELLNILGKIEKSKNKDRLRKKNMRMMIVGVPNVGKSSIINRLTGKKSAQTGDRPGVTKGKQWLTLNNGMQLLDTPGILWPKFEDQKVALNLAFCGSIKDEILPLDELALKLIGYLQTFYPYKLMERYKIDEIYEDALATMEAIAQKRGFVKKGGVIDYERTARTVLDEFRSGKIGKITIEYVMETI